MEYFDFTIRGKIPNGSTKDETINKVFHQLEDIGCKDIHIDLSDMWESVRVV